MSLSDGKYVLLTTFRRNGDPVATPVWIADLPGGGLGFWTSSGSGKAKRLTHTSRVTVQACDARGRVTDGSEPTEATAELITDADPRFAQIQTAIRARYGFMTKVTKWLGTIGGIVKRNRIPYGDRGVVLDVG